MNKMALSRPAKRQIVGITDDEGTKNQKCKFLELPDATILHIMGFLSLASVINLSITCKKLNLLSTNPPLWQRLDLQDLFLKPGKLGYILKRNPKYMRLARAKIAEPQLIPIPSDERVNLTHLDLSNVDISRNTLSRFLGACVNLRKLSLEGVTLGADIFVKLSTNIQVLNLAMTSNVYPDHFREYLRATKELSILNIGWIEQSWTATEFMQLINSLPGTLRQLNISGYWRLMSNLHLANLIERCPLLQRLDLSDNYNISGVSISYIIRLTQLKCLAINRCLKVGLISLEPLKHMENFEFIELNGFESGVCSAKTIRNWLNVHVNCQPFLNIGRPTSESYPTYIWKRLVRKLDRE